jgi:hypothetical protein
MMKTLTLESFKPKTCIPGYADISLRFEWLMVLSSLWLFAGLYLDGWAHNNIPEQIDSFFTPWHLVLYSGYVVSAVILGVMYIVNIRKGYSWLQALPPAYMTSLLGAIIFAVAGNLDFIWHSLFGFEEDVEALVSPSHLSLAVGGVMMMSGPLRAAWQKLDVKQNKISLSALLSLFIVIGVFTFFTQFSNAFSHPQVFVGYIPSRADTYFWDVALISYVLIPTTILLGAILMSVLRWTLPFGSLTFLLAGNSMLMFLMAWRYSHEQWPVLIAALVGGLLADVLLVRLKPSVQRVKALRWFSFLVPVLTFLAYFLSLLLTQGMWWNSNMWLGMIFFSGILGLGLSWLAVPPYSFDEASIRIVRKGEA